MTGRAYGVNGLKAHIREDIKLGELFHSLVLSRNEPFNVVTEPAFALIVLTVVPHLGYRAPVRLEETRTLMI